MKIVSMAKGKQIKGAALKNSIQERSEKFAEASILEKIVYRKKNDVLKTTGRREELRNQDSKRGLKGGGLCQSEY